MNASWTASSARSKSPKTRIRVATARPDSSRKSQAQSAFGSRSASRRAAAWPYDDALDGVRAQQDWAVAIGRAGARRLGIHRWRLRDDTFAEDVSR